MGLYRDFCIHIRAISLVFGGGGFIFKLSFSVGLEPVLGVALVDSMRSTCFCLPRAGIKGMWQHCLA